MDITYIGHSCFMIELSTGYSICFDPYAPGSVPGLGEVGVVADKVLCSHGHRDHNAEECVKSPSRAFNGPFPEIEIIDTYHDEVKGAKRGPNKITIVRSEPDSAVIVHMGDIGCNLTDEQLEKIKGCDLLMIPVGGFYTIDCRQAFELCCRIDPKAVIPMHFRGRGFGYDVISGREEFVELIREKGGREIISGGGKVRGIPDGKTLLLMDPVRFLQ